MNLIKDASIAVGLNDEERGFSRITRRQSSLYLTSGTLVFNLRNLMNVYDLYILILKHSLMLKSQPLLKAPNELIEIQRLFLSEIVISDQKIIPLELPFYNFVCYTIDLLSEFIKSTHEVTFNLFIIDFHIRKYTHLAELYRRFMGYLMSWKKFSDTDQGKLFLSFLKPNRNQKKNVKVFLKLRKILLKSINQKVLQDINLTHQDAVTIVHTMSYISSEQKKILTKRINEHFITKNVKYVNNAKFNSAIICGFFMEEINDKNQNMERFNSNLSNKINKILEKQTEYIQEYEDQEFSNKDIQFDEDTFRFMPKVMPKNEFQLNKENIKKTEQTSTHEKSLVNLDQCLRELNILKERDLQIDNRFKKLNLSRQDDN